MMPYNFKHLKYITKRNSWRGMTAIFVFAFLVASEGPVTLAWGQTPTILNEFDKVHASDGAAQDLFGLPVSVSGDAAIVGAWGNDDNGDRTGSAYVYMREGPGVWVQQAKLLPVDAVAIDVFGYSVAICGDTVVIGSPGDDDNGDGSGSMYVFIRGPLGYWRQQAKLLPSDGAARDEFGRTVAISGDTIVSGAFWDVDNGFHSGSAYVFVRDDIGVWTQQAKLLPADGAFYYQFGFSVAISCDTIVIGSDHDDTLGDAAGSAYIFERDASGVWTQKAKLLANDGSLGDTFGSTVAISGDTAMIGAFRDDTACPTSNLCQSGSVYVFTRNEGGMWTQHAKLLATDGAKGDLFGVSIEIEGNTALIGASGDNTHGANKGSVYVFTRGPLGIWRQQVKYLASDGAVGDTFGSSVAFSGTTAFVGASGDNDKGTNSGSAYILDLSVLKFDLTGDGRVNSPDLAALCAAWGVGGGPADFNSDGRVDAYDLAILLAHWGP